MFRTIRIMRTVRLVGVAVLLAGIGLAGGAAAGEPRTLHLEGVATAQGIAVEYAAAVDCDPRDYLRGDDDQRALFLGPEGEPIASIGLPEPRRVFVEPPDREGSPPAPKLDLGEDGLLRKTQVVLDLPLPPGARTLLVVGGKEQKLLELDLAEVPVVDPVEFGCAMPWSLDPGGDPQAGSPAPLVPEPELPLPGSPLAG